MRERWSTALLLVGFAFPPNPESIRTGLPHFLYNPVFPFNVPYRLGSCTPTP